MPPVTTQSRAPTRASTGLGSVRSAKSTAYQSSARAASRGGFDPRALVLAALERTRQFGFDCGRDLVFRRWTAGGEYTGRVTLRNVSGRSQRIVCRVPRDPAFAVDFPEPVLLRPGMAHTVVVRFRPVREAPVFDTIEVETDVGPMHVPVEATVPVAGVTLPESADLGMCSVGETVSAPVVIENTGDVPVSFTLDVPRPFSVSPVAGDIPVGGTAKVVFTFAPRAAEVYVGDVSCHLSSRGTERIRLEARGKYSHIKLSTEQLDFGDVTAGTATERIVEVLNPGPTACTFHAEDLIPDDDDDDNDNDDGDGDNDKGKRKGKGKDKDPRRALSSFFSISPRTSEIPAGGSAIITVRFAPRAPRIASLDRYAFTTPSGSRCVLAVSGRGTGPEVVLLTPSIDFGDVRVGTTCTGDIVMRNTSAIDAHYQFVCDANGVFRMDKPSGRIAAGFTATVRVSFSPLRPINFYRRVHCVVRDGPAIALDLLGTCYDDRVRPAPFTMTQVRRYRRRVARGEHMDLNAAVIPIDEDDEEAEAQAEDEARAVEAAAAANASQRIELLGRIGGPADPLEAHAAREALFTALSADPFDEIACEPSSLDFGRVAAAGSAVDAPSSGSGSGSDSGSSSLSSTRTIIVRNRSARKMTVAWVPAGAFTRANAERAAADGAESILEEAARKATVAVYPLVGDVEAGGSAEFRVAFRPGKPQRYYAQTLEGYAYPKTQRSYRLVDPDTFVPPACLTVRVTGHSFTERHFDAEARANPPRITFPGATVGERVHANFELHNTGNTAMRFRIPDKWHHPRRGGGGEDRGGASAAPSGEGAVPVLSAVPAVGTIPAGKSMLITLRFAPREAGRLRSGLHVTLNRGTEMEVPVAAVAHRPLVTLLHDRASLRWDDAVGADAVLFLRPTCVRQRSDRVFHVANPSAVPMRFEWTVPSHASGAVAVVPNTGTVEPRGTVPVRIAFMPRETGPLRCRVSCRVTQLPSALQGSAGRGAALRAAPAAIAAADDAIVASGAARPVRTAERTFIVHGTGASGDVRMEPSEVDVPAVLVRTSHAATVSVINSADVGMSYRVCWEYVPDRDDLYYHSSDDEDADGVDAAPMVELSSRKRPAKVLGGGGGGKDHGDAGGQGDADLNVGDDGDGPEDELDALVTLDPENLYVPARSSEKIRIRVHPRRNIKYRFNVWIVPAERGPAPSSAVPASMRCSLTLRAQYPQVSFEDVRAEGLSMTRLRRQLTLRPLNAELEADITGSEEELHASIERDPRLVSKLRAFEFNFGAGRVQSDDVVVRARLRNTGRLAARWEFLFPDDLEGDEEHWTDTGAPTDAERRHAQVTEAGIFAVSPKSGSIAGGQSVEVEFRFRHALVGLHELPVLLRVDRGKQVVLRFTGHTFWPDQPTLHFDTATVALRPVECGDPHAPTQGFDVHNAGDEAVEYSCDLTAVRRVNHDAGRGHDVLVIENPRGYVEPGESARVRVVFRPLEARVYTFELPVAATSGPAAGRTLTLRGGGYLPRQHGDMLRAEARALARLAWTPTLQLPGQLATLSQQFIVFGDVPQHAVCRQVVAVRNVSGSTLSFEWRVGSDDAADLLSVSPAAGELAPGAFAACRFTFLPGARVEVFDMDVSCVVEDTDDAERLDAERSRLLKKVSRAGRPATKAAMRKANLLPGANTAGDDDDEEDLFGAGTESESDMLSRLSTPAPFGGGAAAGAGFGSRAASALSDTRTVSRASTGLSRPGTAVLIEEKLEGLGEARSNALHVNVQCRTHETSGFRRRFGGASSGGTAADAGALVVVGGGGGGAQACHYVPRAANAVDGSLIPSATAPYIPASGAGTEWENLLAGRGDFFSEVISGMLREVLEDPDVAADVAGPDDDTPPLFATLSTNPVFERYRHADGITAIDPAEEEAQRRTGSEDDGADRYYRGGGGGNIDDANSDDLDYYGGGGGGGGGGGDGGDGEDDDQDARRASFSVMSESNGAVSSRQSTTGDHGDGPAGTSRVPELDVAAVTRGEDAAGAVFLDAELDAEEAREKEAERLARLAKRDRKESRERRTIDLLRRVDVEETFEYILEGTVFNIVSEALHGEFNVREVPRKVVTKGLVEVPRLATPGPEELLEIEEEERERLQRQKLAAATAGSFAHATQPGAIRPSSRK